MVLQLSQKTSSPLPLEVEGITPDRLRDLSLPQIERLEVFHGKEKIPLADFFSISGSAADEVHRWSGDLTAVHWLGAKQKSGKIQIEGHAGRHVGSEMTGGEIRVAGNCGDFLGAELHGGLIFVQGNAAHQVGAAYAGTPQGMTRGTIIVTGDAGDQVGHSMRRGLIAIGGSLGELAGVNMLAGTILVLGNGGAGDSETNGASEAGAAVGFSGRKAGAGMRRGTIAFLGKSVPPLLPTFRHSCRYLPPFLPLLLKQLRHHGLSVSRELASQSYDLYCGDLLEGGRGEILVRGAG